MIIARIDNEITPRTPHRRGRSFKGVLSYLFNGARHDPHPERVLHAETFNIWSDIGDAAHEMAVTWEARFRLMGAAGLFPKNGSDNKAPVYHFVMSWRPDEDPPTPEEMAEHAKQLLHLIGLGEHEAVLVVHGDTANPHIHVIANTVHPITGRTAALRFDKRIMQDFAARYEELRETIVCKGRFHRGAKAAFGQACGAGWGARRANRARWARQSEVKINAARIALPSVILDTLTHHHATFTAPQLARAITEATRSPKEFTALMAAVMASPDLVQLHNDQTRTRYTTRAQKEADDRLTGNAMRLASSIAHSVTATAGSSALRTFAGPAQAGTREALTHLLDERGLSIVVGYAGAGKSTLLRAAADAWKASGYQPRGLALAGRAAEGLEADAGIAAGTIAAFLYGLDNRTVTLTSRDILVIDEAGMVGSRQLDRILDSAAAAGAKVVLVGDPEQLQAIEAGGPFRYLVNHHDHARLSTVWRQRQEWMRIATRDLAEHRTEAALAAYEDKDMLQSHETTEEAVDAILDQWQSGRDIGGTQLILTATNADAASINTAARARLHAIAALGPDQIVATADGPAAFATGDRILFRRNDKHLKVKNGTTGTVVAISDRTITVAIDGQPSRTVRVLTAIYPHITHGYAVTIHKSQGATVDRTFVLASPTMDRHGTYVALSRHRDRVSLHWSRDQFANRAALGRRLSRARLKDVTLDYRAAVAAVAPDIAKAAKDAERAEIDAWSALYDAQRREADHYHALSILRRAFWMAAQAARFITAGVTSIERLHEHERAELAAQLQTSRQERKPRRKRLHRAIDILMGRTKLRHEGAFTTTEQEERKPSSSRYPRPPQPHG